MALFETMSLPAVRDAVAPDGSDVRVLLGLGSGSLAHFELGPGRVSRAVIHKTVEEVWYFISGRGQMWRSQADREETVDVFPGVCLTIPTGTRFQFRASANGPLAAVAVTMPPWPGEAEADIVAGIWEPAV